MPKAEPPLTLAHCLIHQSRSTICLQKSNPTRFSATLSSLVRRCLNSSSRAPREGSDFFTFLYDNFIYLNLMYGLTKLSLLKHNIRFIQKVTRWQVIQSTLFAHLLYRQVWVCWNLPLTTNPLRAVGSYVSWSWP